MTTEQLKELDERAEMFAETVVELYKQDVRRALREWYDEHTTLRGEEGERYLTRLERAVFARSAAKLAVAAARFE